MKNYILAFTLTTLGITQIVFANSSKFSIIYSFNGYYEQPEGSLLNLHDSTLYGNSERGIYSLNLKNNALQFINSEISPDSISFSLDKNFLYGISNSFKDGYIFKLHFDGTSSILHTFNPANHLDQGYDAIGTIIETKDHTLYGVTESGGVVNARSNSGVIYQLKANGEYQVIHAFTGDKDGVRPIGSLVMTSDEKYIYGATINGKKPYYCGALFRVDLTKQKPEFTTLHSLNCNDDQPRFTSLIISKDDKSLFGTTSNGYGSVVKVNLRKSDYPITILHTFSRDKANGITPNALALDKENKVLYGITRGGEDKWNSYQPTIFKIRLDNSCEFTTLYVSSVDENTFKSPQQLTISDDNKYLFGLTSLDGEYTSGTVFKYDIG